ncbi:hypothetical protein HMPREF9141_1697 [Prevotella multiformis DSM 16608]|uniref:Uncharacterized protein n=1 Tax=Prevotella multiformis DSM 16608 TaxID=888743 RepID=F0F7Y0_9BACT|nr:hypothetical protein HMPREF9141_1697 [Prevotella multiformis DSM 16608]
MDNRTIEAHNPLFFFQSMYLTEEPKKRQIIRMPGGIITG